MSRASSAQAAAAAVPVRRNTTLFVDGLAESFASGDLTALFAQYGQVVEGEVFVDNNNVSRGFGFVTMHSTEAAARAKAELDLKTLPGVSPGRPLKVRWALDKGTLYVGDLGPDVTGDQLQEVSLRLRLRGRATSCKRSGLGLGLGLGLGRPAARGARERAARAGSQLPLLTHSTRSCAPVRARQARLPCSPGYGQD